MTARLPAFLPVLLLCSPPPPLTALPSLPLPRRMKIGICEGSPRSIIPDHLGRADYHGASINQAARYMDAAAHGGMIALEASLALKVMVEWQSAGRTAVAEAGESGLTSVAAAAAEVAAGAAAAAAATAAAAGSSSFTIKRPPPSMSVVQ
ncbi:hypothetical protein Agub_g8955, partial [Astrephomene gubernaculifera]